MSHLLHHHALRAYVTAGIAWPALPWLTQFCADSGLANRVSGPNLVPAANAPLLTQNVYGNRAAWRFDGTHPDYFNLTLSHSAPTHYLLAFVATIDETGNNGAGGNGAMLLGSTMPQALYWQFRISTRLIDNYVQAQQVMAQLERSTPTVVVAYVDTAGKAKLLVNNQLYVGDTAQPVSATTHTYRIGDYAAGTDWELTGKLGAHAIAARATGFTDAEALSVRDALKTYYSL